MNLVLVFIHFPMLIDSLRIASMTSHACVQMLFHYCVSTSRLEATAHDDLHSDDDEIQYNKRKSQTKNVFEKAAFIAYLLWRFPLSHSTAAVVVEPSPRSFVANRFPSICDEIALCTAIKPTCPRSFLKTNRIIFK